ncbi:MAG: UV DNA damage repair endonuclease UvsE [Clostridia bacterium]
MSIGYACLTVGVLNTDQKTCMQKNASPAKLTELIQHNLGSLENIIDYNIKNEIKLFRISSDLIPFGSSSFNSLLWWKIFSAKFEAIGEKIRKSGMRVSMHPGQYTVLNSPNEEVVRRAVADLDYHALLLECLGVGMEHKIVLHIGGVYQDKKAASARFVASYQKLSTAVKSRLVIENDDKSYNISDVLALGKFLHAPVIFDNLHHAINPSELKISETEWIEEARKTWQVKDGKQKIHYSQQNPLNRVGSHATSIRIDEFLEFYHKVSRTDLDIMLEVKDKNISALKCINATSTNKGHAALEQEWCRYKYKVLENAPLSYPKIEQLLNNGEAYPVRDFYRLVESALSEASKKENQLRTMLHIWEKLQDDVTEQESKSFFKSIENFKAGRKTLESLKNVLWKLALQYQKTELLQSYYFAL